MENEKENTVIEATDEDFEEKVLERSKKTPVLVDFWADWCTPCKQLSPILEDVTEEMDGEVALAEVNVDEAKNKAGEYGVRSIPNVKLFVDGEVQAGFVGSRSKEDVLDWVDENI